jgi:hypothetical protein
MFTVTHFRSEFVRQSQATILRRVTMTQFMLVIVTAAIGVGLFGAPFWLAPAFMALGYVAGHQHQGEILLRRVLAYALVWARSAAGRPRLVDVQAEWDGARTSGRPSPAYARQMSENGRRPF